jgi:hypothetical protein
MEEPKNNPGKKMRTLLAGSKLSPLARLPKKTNAGSDLPPKADKKDEVPAESKGIPLLKGKGLSFKKKETKKETPQTASPPKLALPASRSFKLNLWPTFWTIASVLSMVVNVILVVALLVLLPKLKKIDTNNLLLTGNDLLGNLYTNFEKMDRAHITTNIPVETTIPVKFDLQLNQQTNVVLSQAVTIDNARVTVKTGGLNITNAITTIVLPQGTTLPVVLNLTVPVDTTVPVKLNVNVDIPMAQTQLHEPFSGLQEAVKPIYCMLNANAVNLDKQPICK